MRGERRRGEEMCVCECERERRRQRATSKGLRLDEERVGLVKMIAFCHDLLLSARCFLKWVVGGEEEGALYELENHSLSLAEKRSVGNFEV